MTSEHKPNGEQQQRVLEVFHNANGGWVDGTIFYHLESPILQYHARMWELEKKGYIFEDGWIENENTGKRWKKYRLVSEPQAFAPVNVYTPMALMNHELAKQKQLF